MTIKFNWSWIKSADETANKSDSVIQDNSIIYTFRQSNNGQISSNNLTAFNESVSQNFQNIKSNWRLYTRPVLNSLPAGRADKRWNLSDKINCFTYGLQGSTLFVFNDANNTSADGRYWDSTYLRPKTIAEAFEDVYEQISLLSESITTTTSTDLDPLWAAIGEDYRNSSKVSSFGSLDNRLSTTETYINQINIDLYDPENYTYSLGNSPPYSFAKVLDELLQLHNVSGWGADPTAISHSGIPITSHTHSYNEILPYLNNSLTQNRTAGPYSTLENDILRLRYEIRATKFGTGAGVGTWYSDPIDPVTTTAGYLEKHIQYVGTGTPSSSNPHAITYVETGAETVFTAIRSYTGMTSNSDIDPAYSSTNYILNDDSLVTAIGKLDNALSTLLGTTVIRMDYSYDRSSLSETERERTPIVITHSIGRKPIVQVTDVTPESENEYGMYASEEMTLGIVHNSDDEFEIWTNAAQIEIIALF